MARFTRDEERARFNRDGELRHDVWQRTPMVKPVWNLMTSTARKHLASIARNAQSSSDKDAWSRFESDAQSVWALAGRARLCHRRVAPLSVCEDTVFRRVWIGPQATELRVRVSTACCCKPLQSAILIVALVAYPLCEPTVRVNPVEEVVVAASRIALAKSSGYLSCCGPILPDGSAQYPHVRGAVVAVAVAVPCAPT